jgi:DNA-binding transcriptional regulator YiaG
MKGLPAMPHATRDAKADETPEERAERVKKEGRNFREWREAHQWTQERAGVVLGASADTVRQWETGRREIPGPIRVLRRYIDHCGLIDEAAPTA